MCTRSNDSGENWSAPVPIGCTRWSQKPDAVADSETHEVYPGTLTLLPDDRVLCTWDNTYAKYPQQGRPLLYTISDSRGESWGEEQQLIFDPADPPDAALDEVQHLGTLRHSILVQDDGRWLLPLTVGGPRGSPSPGEVVGTRSLCEWYGVGYPGVQIYDPETGGLEPVPELSPGRPGCHPSLEYPILQVARNASGAMLAMGKGNSGHNQEPPETPSPAPVLFCPGAGEPWEEVEGFPANIDCPDGVDIMEWDDDGDRWGRTPRYVSPPSAIRFPHSPEVPGNVVVDRP